MTKLVYIVSPSYSGSTLLAFLIATHPDIGTLGERKHFHRKIIAPLGVGSPYCSCGNQFTECNFWLSVKSAIEKDTNPSLLRLDFANFQFYRSHFMNQLARKLTRGYAVKRGETYLPFFLKQRLNDILSLNKRLIEAVLAASNTSIFLDSSKTLIHAIYLDILSEIEVSVLHLFRDPRAQVASTLKYYPQFNAIDAARQWVSATTEQGALLKLWGGKCMTVHYEKLCASPKNTMQQLFEFIGVDPSRGTLYFRGENQHIMGNAGTRLSKIDEIHDPQHWRQQLTAEQLAAIGRIAGNTSRRFGYML